MSDFLTHLISNVVFASGLAVLAWGITRVWRNPHLARALWLLVLIKLVTPPVIHVPLPDLGFAVSDNASAIHHDNVPTREEVSISVASDDRNNTTRPGATPEVEPTTSRLSRESGNGAAEVAATPVLSVLWKSLAANWRWALLIAWGIGASAFAVVALRRHGRLLRLIDGAVDAHKALIEQASAVARRIGLSRCPTLRVIPARISPLAFVGWRKRFILLPGELIAELDDEQTQSVLAHELTHIHRRDHLVRCFELLVLMLHWWNPIAWLAVRRLQQAEEECCDAAVVWALPECRGSYGRALLRTVEFLTEARSAAPVAGSAFGRFSFKRRIEMIVKGNRQRTLSWQSWAVVMLLGAALLPLSAQTKSAASLQSDRDNNGHKVEKPATRQPPGEGETPEKKPAAAAQVYSLDKAEVVKRIAPPFPKSRENYTRRPVKQPRVPWEPPTAMYFRWNADGIKLYGESSGESRIPTLMRMLSGIYSQEIHGDGALLTQAIPGDFIVRIGETPEKVAAQLESILRTELKWKVKLTFREVERKVFVAKGTYKFQPLPGRPKRIQIYSTALGDARIGGGGGGDLKKFLNWVGMWIKRPVIAGTIKAVPKRVRWHYNDYHDKLRAGRLRGDGQKNPKLVMKNLTAQTGLTFTEEKRKVRVLFVERTKE